MGHAPSTQRVYETFDDIKSKFEKELVQRASAFENQVYDLTLNKKPDLKTEVTQAISKDTAVVNAELKPSDLDKANENAKEDPAPAVKPPTDRQGRPIDLSAKPAGNQLIILYNDQTAIVQQSNKTDFAGLKESIAKVTNAVAKTFPSAADGSFGGILSSLATNPEKVASSINTVVSGILGMCSTSANVGLNSHANIQYVPPGIYVGSLTFSSSIMVKNSSGQNSVMMWLVKTVVCTSTDLLNAGVVRTQVLEKLQTNRISRLNVVQSLGKVIGMANASDLGTTIFFPVSAVQLNKSVDHAEKSADKHPPGPAPSLQDVDEARSFAKAVDWKDLEGKAAGWDVVLEMYHVLAAMADRNNGIDSEFKAIATVYQGSITRLNASVKDDYRLLRDELKREEEDLMKMIGV